MATVSPLSLSRRAKSPKKEVKIKESKDLKAFSELLTEVLAQAEPDAKDTAALRKLADVLGNHTAKAPSDKTTPQALNMALFSGCKLQLKPSAWVDDDTVSEVVLVLKWGGALTELGVEHGAARGCEGGQLQTAPISVVFHSFWLIFRRAIISRSMDVASRTRARGTAELKRR